MRDDFTLSSYRHILELAQFNDYQFIGFDQVGKEQTSSTCLLRHDIDSELWSCLEMAKIERELGVEATYFVMLRSTAYNLFCIESLTCLKNLVSQGHKIGLHFMGELCDTDSAAKVREKVILEVDVLKRELGCEINAVSFHQPSKTILDYDLQIGDLINTYNKIQLKDYYYFSDTNMQWKSGHPEEVFSKIINPRLQLLIHPIWWTRQQESAKNKWQNVLDKNRKTIVEHWMKRERSLINVDLSA